MQRIVVKHRTFRNQEVLGAMLSLRAQGWPIKLLGELFNCDHTSIRKACLRNGLPPEVEILPRPVIVFRRVFLEEWGERINPGKNYKDYLTESKRRKSQLTIRL